MAVCGNLTAPLGRGSPFHSLDCRKSESLLDQFQHCQTHGLHMSKQKPFAVSVTRGLDGQWKFDPPFEGGSYPEFKAWDFHAQQAVEDYLRIHGEKPSNVVPLGIPDISKVNWDVLTHEDVLAFAAEALDSGEGESVLSVSWDFGTPMHNGINTFWKIGEWFFADLDEGMLGPFSSLEEALEETEMNQPLNAGLIYESESRSAQEIAFLLRGDLLTPGEEILINNERWAANSENAFAPVKTQART